MKTVTLLRRMNIIDKAVLLLLFISLMVGIGITAFYAKDTTKVHTATVLFPTKDTTFGQDAIPGETILSADETPIGAVYERSISEAGVSFTFTCDHTFPGAVGEDIYLRSKHFAGVGKIQVLNREDAP